MHDGNIFPLPELKGKKEKNSKLGLNMRKTNKIFTNNEKKSLLLSIYPNIHYSERVHMKTYPKKKKKKKKGKDSKRKKEKK